MSAQICAAPGCDNPLPIRPARVGRPPIYCSPTCRPSRRPTAIVVEADACEDDDRGHDWEVRLRRGGRVVVVQRGLGRFSATALATDIGALLGGASS